MVFFITFMMLAFVYINFETSNRDWISPRVIFSLLFFICSILCAFIMPRYEIQFHVQTLWVLFLGSASFTIVGYAAEHIPFFHESSGMRDNDGVIYINNIITLLCIGLLLVYALFMTRYIRTVCRALGASGSFSSLLGVYNKYVKNSTLISEMGLGRSSFFINIDLICRGLTYIIMYVCIYNLVFYRKKNLLQFLYIAIAFIVTFFTGSRSNGFRIITAVAIYFLIFLRAKKGIRFKFDRIIKIGFLGIIVFCALILGRTLIGRSDSYDLLSYMFAYLGGPLANLDIYLSEGHINTSTIFGEQTFGYLINDFARLFGKSDMIYLLDLPYNYPNGLYLGNVYTTFYMFIYDFGYIGIVPLTAGISWYYCRTYHKIGYLCKKDYGNIRLDIVIFAYLFNDLIMLPFSNRFYETAFRLNFVKMIVFMIVIKYLMFNLVVGKKALKLRLPRGIS